MMMMVVLMMMCAPLLITAIDCHLISLILLLHSVNCQFPRMKIIYKKSIVNGTCRTNCLLMNHENFVYFVTRNFLQIHWVRKNNITYCSFFSTLNNNYTTLRVVKYFDYSFQKEALNIFISTQLLLETLCHWINIQLQNFTTIWQFLYIFCINCNEFLFSFSKSQFSIHREEVIDFPKFAFLENDAIPIFYFFRNFNFRYFYIKKIEKLFFFSNLTRKFQVFNIEFELNRVKLVLWNLLFTFSV